MRGTNLIENVEVDIVNGSEFLMYEVDVIVEWSYEPGCWYRSNGDPGDPPSSDWDFEIIHAHLVNEDGEREEVGSERFAELYSETHEKLNNLTWEELTDE